MEDLNKNPNFPRYPNGSVFKAYRVNQKELRTIEFDCIRYGNLLRNNKIIASKSKVCFSFAEANKKQKRMIHESKLRRDCTELRRDRENAELRQISPREKEVLLLYYESKLTIREIAAKYRVTSNRIMQIQGKALRKLKITSSKRSFADAILAIINPPANTPNTPPPAPPTSDARK